MTRILILTLLLFTATVAAANPNPNTGIRERIVDFFTSAGAQALIRVADCESTFRQYDDFGNVLWNEEGSSAVGAMQIMASIHVADALRLGYNIYTLEGNLGYAKHLFRKQGLKPWKSSARCWRK